MLLGTDWLGTLSGLIIHNERKGEGENEREGEVKMENYLFEFKNMSYDNKC